MEISLTPGAMPANGTFGVSAAAMMPATAVPCPRQSILPVPVRSTGLLTAFSCGCVLSTPLSTIATVTPAPLLSLHTSGRLKRRWAHDSLMLNIPRGGEQSGASDRRRGRDGSCDR